MTEYKTQKTDDFIAKDLGSRGHIHTLALIAMTASGLYLCYQLAAPFLPVLAWALALTILFAPLYRWIESKVKHPNVAAMICVLVVGVIVVVPVSFVAQRIIGEGARGAETVKSMIESGSWRRTVEAHPRIAPVSHWIEQQLDLPESMKNAIRFFRPRIGGAVNWHCAGVVYSFLFPTRPRHGAQVAPIVIAPLRHEHEPII